MTKIERSYWVSVSAVIVLITVVSLRIYHPGFLVEFSDTIYPIRPELTMQHWMSWWWSGNLGSIWTNVCWLPYLIIPYAGWLLHLDPGLAQALQYYSWLLVPVVGVAMCIHRLTYARAGWLGGLCVTLVAFNSYIAVTWTLCVAMYSMGSAALYAWAFVEGIERKRFWRGIVIAAFAALWMSPDAANPPLFLIVVLNTVIFGLWLFARNGFTNRRHWFFAGAVGLVSILVGVRWLVPFVINFTSYPLTSLATGASADFSWVTARAHLVNVLRMSQYWYWGDPLYTFYATDYEKNSALIFLSFAPFLVLLLACWRAVRQRMNSALWLMLIVLSVAFVAKNGNVPFSGLGKLIYHLPLMSLFRDSEKFLILFTVDGAIACGLIFAENALTPRFKTIVTAAIVAAVIGNGWLVWSGKMFWGTRGTPPLYVRVPEDYRSLSDDLAAMATHRVLTSPWDQTYTIGTSWGFLGADTEFFDDLPDRPLFHHAYYSYVDHPFADQLINLFASASGSDEELSAALEDRLAIDGVIVRADAAPYVGFYSAALRHGDLSRRYATFKSLPDFELYRARKPASYVHVSGYAVAADEYDATFYLLNALGIRDVPVVEAPPGNSRSHTAWMTSVERGIRSDAYAILPQALGMGRFAAPPGAYTLVARADSTPRQSVDGRTAAAAPLPSEPRVFVIGVRSDIRHDADRAEPAEDAFSYVNESSNSARGTLELAAFGQSEGGCADVMIDQHLIDRAYVSPGKQLLRFDATVPPGAFTVRLVLGARGTCRRVDVSGSPPLWTAFTAPKSFYAQPVAGRLRSTQIYSAALSAPLSTYPTVAVNAQESRHPLESSVVLRAHITGGGCSATVAQSDASSAVAPMNVVTELRRIGRRPYLPRACLNASLSALRVDRVDAVAIAPLARDLVRISALSIVPANPAVAWTSLMNRARSRAVGVVPNTSSALWTFAYGLPPGAAHGLFDFSTANSCGISLRLRVSAVDSSGRTITRTLDDLSRYQHTSGFQTTLSNTVLAHATVRLDDVFGGRGVAIRSISIVPPRAAFAPAWCSAHLVSVSVGTPAISSLPAALTVDGKRFPVPRDDRPHRIDLALSAPGHVISADGPLFGAVLLPAKVLHGNYDVSETQLGDSLVDMPRAGWVVVRRAFDNAWEASEASKSGVEPLLMNRADVDEQAFYLPKAGRLNVRFRFDAARIVAECVSWFTLSFVVAIWILRRERE